MSRPRITIALVLVCVALGMGAACDALDTHNGGPGVAKKYKVKYEAFSCGNTDSENLQTSGVPKGLMCNYNRVNVTYSNESGGTSQKSSSVGPWSYEFTGSTGDRVSVSASDGGKGKYNLPFTIIVRIYVDGVKVKENISEGKYVTASVDVSL